MKQCTKCKQQKEGNNFSRDKYSKDGLTSWCKNCQKEHYILNKKEIVKRSKKYQRSHKNETNHNSRKWRKNNSEQFNKIVRNWEKEHRKQYHFIKNKAQAKRKRNLGFIPLMSNPFPDEIQIDYHHINNVFVIPIPRQVHKNMLGKNHRREVNNWIEEYIGLIGV